MHRPIKNGFLTILTFVLRLSKDKKHWLCTHIFNKKTRTKNEDSRLDLPRFKQKKSKFCCRQIGKNGNLVDPQVFITWIKTKYVSITGFLERVSPKRSSIPKYSLVPRF